MGGEECFVSLKGRGLEELLWCGCGGGSGGEGGAGGGCKHQKDKDGWYFFIHNDCFSLVSVSLVI